MRRVAIFALTVLLMQVFGIASGSAESRIALVIGNGAYRHLRPLGNPPNDARDLAKALEGLGFTVDLGVDLQRFDMERKLTDFARRAATADVALAFFAGHGVQAPDPLGSGQPANYLLPVDANIQDVADLGFLPTVRDIMARLQLAPGVRILILDACRDNPVPQRLAAAGRTAGAARGLAPPPRAAGTLIAFSTQPDAIADDGAGRNSPFVASLLNHIAKPGLDVRLLFADVRADVIRTSKGAQNPETWDSLNGRFSFREAVIPPAAPAPAQPGVATPQAPPAAAPASQPAQIATVVVPPPMPQSTGGPCGNVPSTVSVSTRTARPLSAAEECRLKPKDVFKECEKCPEMVVVPAGSFKMGAPDYEVDGNGEQRPVHDVTIQRAFAAGKFAVTFDEWDACVAAGGCNGFKPSDRGWGRGSRPVINVTWEQAHAYIAWLSRSTRKQYRLLTEAEREYVTRADTATAFWWGNSISPQQANYNGTSNYNNGPKGEWRKKTVPVDQFEPNPWRLYQVHGNVYEWTEDCWNDNYNGAPSDGTAWMTGGCDTHVIRGGSWVNAPWFLRAAHRSRHIHNDPFVIGFRVARTLQP